MSWWWIAALVLAGLVALVVAVGALLPVGHRAARCVRLRAAPAVVWAAITDHAAMPRWRPGLKSITALPDRLGRRRFREVTQMGPMDLEVVEEVAERRLVQRIITEHSPFGGTWTYRLESKDGGTELTITENGEVYNLVFRALARFVFGHTKTMELYLRALVEHLGEQAAVAPGEPDRPPG